MKTKILGIGFLLLALAGTESCGPNGDLALNTVTDSEYEAIKELRTGQYNGGTGSFSQNGGSVSGGGARPQTVEIIKTLGERCPDITVSNQPDRANYVVTLDHEGGKGLLKHRNKVALFNRNGDVLYSHSTITLGDSVKDVCEMMHSDLNSRKSTATN